MAWINNGIELSLKLKRSTTKRNVDSEVLELNLLVNDHWDLLLTCKWLKAHLPPRVVAELELNSVIPPPDTIEEANKELRNQSLLRKPNPHYSTHSVVIAGTSKEINLFRNGLMSLRLDQSTKSSKLMWDCHGIKKSGQWLH